MPVDRVMPRRDRVDPAFDGHAARPFSEQTAEERLDWLWALIVLRHGARRLETEPEGALARADEVPFAEEDAAPKVHRG